MDIEYTGDEPVPYDGSSFAEYIPDENMNNLWLHEGVFVERENIEVDDNKQSFIFTCYLKDKCMFARYTPCSDSKNCGYKLVEIINDPDEKERLYAKLRESPNLEIFSEILSQPTVRLVSS